MDFKGKKEVWDPNCEYFCRYESRTCKKQKELLLDAVELLWDTGLTVVVSAGNYGPEEGTVAVPGNSRKVITVGVPDSNLPYSRKAGRV